MTERKCPVCGGTFLAYHHQMTYCSKECHDKAKKKRSEVPAGLLEMRRARYERLRHYVDRNDLRPALAKYKPTKGTNK